MRFLLDMGISPKVLGVLRSLGHDAIRCSEVGLYGRLTEISSHTRRPRIGYSSPPISTSRTSPLLADSPVPVWYS